MRGLSPLTALRRIAAGSARVPAAATCGGTRLRVGRSPRAEAPGAPQGSFPSPGFLRYRREGRTATARTAGGILGRCTVHLQWIAVLLSRVRRAAPAGMPEGRWKLPVSMAAAAFLVASCVGGSDQTIGSRALTHASAGLSDTQTADPPNSAAGNETILSPAAGPSATADDLSSSDPPVSGHAAPLANAHPVAGQGTSRGGRRVSLRPMDNVLADDLLDHWGHRPTALLSKLLSPAPEPGAAVAELEVLVEAARKAGTGAFVPGLQDGDTVTVLGQRKGVTYGRWSGGPADTLAIAFDLRHASREMREDASFRAALARAGKAWSRRIDDTWTGWERRAGESKGRLIGDHGFDGREIRVGPGGETSTGLVIYATDADLGGDTAGTGGVRSLLPGDGWEPHTGAVAFDRDRLGEAGEAERFRTMVHEIGHVLGAWYGADRYGSDRSFVDRDAGTWTGPHVEAVHGGPAPFQDADDAFGWHDGERSPDASRFDFFHSGVCTSAMAYCAQEAAVPALLPAEIDFAFLADIGMTILPQTDRPETYGHAGWMDYAAFTVSVFRELDVSLADPQARYVDGGAPWSDLETVDLLWAEADAFGMQSAGSLAASFPLAGTVRYAGGLIGTAIDIRCVPPVYGDASLWIGLEDLRGKASFTSLETEHSGGRYVFGDGSLHYPIAVTADGIRDEVSGASLVADFYGPRHDEVAGTLDDSRAGLIASFGARQDGRRVYLDAIEDADHVRGMAHRSGFGDGVDGWYRFRCGSGSACEENFEWWKPESGWSEVSAAGDGTARERVLEWTAGWGDWVAEDVHADLGAIRIARRHAGSTDGRRGRYSRDGYFGTMTHASFGTGFHGYHDWEDDGALRNFHTDGTGFQGDLSGTRPAGNAIWEGRMVGRQSGVEPGEDPFVQGQATVSVSLFSNEVDIGFSGVASMDRARSLTDFGFDDIPLASDGTFEGFDRGLVEGAFFGPAHDEAAGMFRRNDNGVTGSFGAVGQDQK